MQIHWCWGCQTDVPMLEQHEWEVIAKAHNIRSKGGRDAAFEVLISEAHRLGIDPPLAPSNDTKPIAKPFWHLIAGYHMFSGILEDSPNPIYHHVLSAHGPPCKNCGKLLRTTKAAHCAVCGADVN